MASFNKSASVQSALVAGLRLGQHVNGTPLSPLFPDGFPGGLESGLRAALEVQGVSMRYLRAPEDTASDAQLDVVRQLLASLGLLKA